MLGVDREAGIAGRIQPTPAPDLRAL